MGVHVNPLNPAHLEPFRARIERPPLRGGLVLTYRPLRVGDATALERLVADKVHRQPTHDAYTRVALLSLYSTPLCVI
jgi:hypothetical protein